LCRPSRVRCHYAFTDADDITRGRDRAVTSEPNSVSNEAVKRVWRSLLVAAAGAPCVLSLALSARPAQESEPSPFAPLPLEVPAPPDNPTTPDKVALGRLLFWDPILSGSRDIACATCHHPDFGYADGRALPIGTGGRGIGPKRTFPQPVAPLVKRNSQTILNAAFNGLDAEGHVDPTAAPMFWDVRSRGLEAQALVPMETLEEMRGPDVAAGDAVRAAVERVARVPEYQRLFARAFDADDAVTPQHLARAIAAFERTLITTDAPFDRYLRGDRAAMSPVELRGMAAFDSHGCTLCHKGPMLSDFSVHVVGVSDNPLLGAADPGVDGRFAFRTPSLRNVALTAPYMHSGLLADLGSAVGFYKIVGGGGGLLQHYPQPLHFDGRLVLGSPVDRTQLDPLLRQVNVNNQLDDIVAFLGTLSGTFDGTVPRRVPSGLRPGGR
jgi:cytochrome c peroxidase